jgi:hypothetical protein
MGADEPEGGDICLVGPSSSRGSVFQVVPRYSVVQDVTMKSIEL